MNDLKRYEKDLFAWSKVNKNNVLEIIRTEKVFSADIEKQITDLLDSFSLYWQQGEDANE